MTATSHYDRFTGPGAENYERYFVPVIPTPLAHTLLAQADLQPGERVLDVACGTGIVARLAAERVGPGGAVTGVDVSPDMIALARSLTTTACTGSQAPIEWREAKAVALPVDDQSFDVVASQLGLMFVEEKGAAASEIRRALTPGGRVFINVPGEIQAPFVAMGKALARHVDPQLEGFVHALFSMPDPNELERLLTGVGLTEVETRLEHRAFRLPPPADFLWQYVNATPMGALFADVPDEVRAAVEADVVEQWQPFVAVDGAMRYEQPIVWGTARG